MYFWTESVAKRVRVSGFALAWIGGAMVGILAFLSGNLLVGYGHLAINLEVFGRMAWWALALLAVGKILATSLTLNTGGSGGVFTPSLFVGAATGGAFGVGLAALFPTLGLHPEAYALVGMGAVVAAATAAPITGILIVFEMTNDYAIMMPLMVTTVIAFVVRRRYEPDSLYSGWLRRRGEHLEHGADRDILARLVVEDAIERNPQVIGEHATLAQLVEHLESGAQADYPVVDSELQLVGMITLAEIGRIARDESELSALVVAADLANPVDGVHPRDSLLATSRRLGVRGTAALPVVEPGTRKLIGMISRGDILACYEKTLAGTEAPAATAQQSATTSPEGRADVR
jgi:CIC family chloride channel protein